MGYGKGGHRGVARRLMCLKCHNDKPEEMTRLKTVGDVQLGKAQLRCDRCGHTWWSTHQDRLTVPWC
jgi:ribosomal protein S27AE